MARATWIYILIYRSPIHNEPRTVGAWTVKHELYTFIEKNTSEVDRKDRYHILAYRDGKPYEDTRVILLDS